MTDEVEGEEMGSNYFVVQPASANRGNPAQSSHAGTVSSRSPQYLNGRRNAIKACVAWLHAEADRMNDPHARAILNGAAFGMGIHFKSHEASVTLNRDRPTLNPEAEHG